MRQITRARFGKACKFRNVIRAAVDGGQGVRHTRPGEFQLCKHFCHPVLQRLKASDQLPELLTLLHILKRLIESCRAETQHFSRQTNARAVEYGFQNVPCLIHAAKNSVLANRHIFQSNMSRTVTIKCVQLLHRDAVRIAWNKEQRQALCVTRFACGARDNNQHVSMMTIRDKPFCAIECVTLPIARRFCCDACGGMMCAFIQRERKGGVATCDLWQPLRLLSARPAKLQRRRCNAGGLQ